MQAKDVSGEKLMRTILAMSRGGQAIGVPADDAWVMIWDIEKQMPEVPSKVLRAKLDKLVKRKLVDGCTCGCRGDFFVTEHGRWVLEHLEKGPTDAPQSP